MKKYFPDNLPMEAPGFYIENVREIMNHDLKTMHKRIQRLNEALAYSKLQPELFSDYAKRLFKMGPQHFDTLSAEEIAAIVMLLDDGHKAQERIWFPNAIPLLDADFVTRNEWETVKKLGIHRDDIPVIDGSSPEITQYDLYCQKHGFQPKQETAASLQKKNRIFLKDEAIAAFCRIAQAKRLRNSIVWQKKAGRSLAYPDAVVQLANGHLFVFEGYAEPIVNRIQWEEGKIPRYFSNLTYHDAAILQDDRIKGTELGCLFLQNDDFLFESRHIPRDETMENEILRMEEKWFSDHIIEKKIPEKCGPVAKELLSLRNYEISENESTIHLRYEDFNTAIEAYEIGRKTYENASKLAKQAKENCDRLSLPFLEIMGNATTAVIPAAEKETYFEISNRPRSKTTVNRKKLEEIINVLPAYNLPQAIIDSLKGCIEVNDDSYRIFQLKKKMTRIKKETEEFV